MSSFKNIPEYDPKYANWNPFYEDLFTQIREIRELSTKSFHDLRIIPSYYSRVSSLFNTHGHYVLLKNKKEIEKILIKIDNKLCDTKFIEKNKLNTQTQTWHQIRRELNTQFKIMCEDFAENGISVKVTKKNQKNPSKALKNTH